MHPLTTSTNCFYENKYLTRSCKEGKDPTSVSAFLVKSVGISGSVPGLKGIPKKARTSFFGGGRRYKDMNLIALASVCPATC